MSIFKGIKKAHEDQDMEALMSLHHDDCEFISHSNGASVRKAEFMERMSRFWLDPSFDERMQRCIYENDDIMVEHSVMRFPDGSRESLMAVNMLENGQVIRRETGATPMK